MIRYSHRIAWNTLCGKDVDISQKCLFVGPLAHLVERLHGMEEVRSSSLLRSTVYGVKQCFTGSFCVESSAPIVQRIERSRPKGAMYVRFILGALARRSRLLTCDCVSALQRIGFTCLIYF